MSSRKRYTMQGVLTNTFCKFPKFLLTEEFSKMSNDAKVLYTVMLERHDLSIKNNWCDDNGEIFIYYTRENMQTNISKSPKTVIKAVKELKEFGLIEEFRQGLSKPNKIYLLTPTFTLPTRSEPPKNEEKEPLKPVNIADMENLHVKTWNNSMSRVGESPCQDMENFHPNNTNISNPDFSHQSSPVCPVVDESPEEKPTDGRDESDSITLLENLIKDNIEYSCFTRQSDITLVDNFVAVIVDTMHTKTKIFIGEEEKSQSVVKSVFSKLTHRDIQHALEKFNSVTHPITKKAKYIRTLLYNSKLEGDAHWQNAYNVDKYETN